jgi:hypothetical protein
MICAFLSVGKTCAASVPSSGVLVQGPGTETCAEVAQYYRQDPKLAKALFFSWAQGFLSGVNMSSLPVTANVGAMTVENQEAYLREYCETHPLMHYVEAVMALYTSLPKSQRRSSN